MGDVRPKCRLTGGRSGVGQARAAIGAGSGENRPLGAVRSWLPELFYPRNANRSAAYLGNVGMRRREFIALLGAAAWGAGARAEQPKKLPRIGFLANRFQGHVDPFRQGLGELGYVEGVNIRVEYREAEGKIERLPAQASELVDLGVDLIVA